MARNGSGTYSLPAGNPVVTGTSISSTWANNTLNDISAALTQSISVDGQTAITANLPMTGFKHTNVANATARTEYGAAGQVQDSPFHWLTFVSGTDTITATAALGLSAYAAGQTFRFVSAGANTGTSVTLNLNGIGAKSVTKLGATALAVGDIPSGAVVEVVYDGTQFQLVGIAARNVYGSLDGAVTATTQNPLDSSTKVATTAFVERVGGVVGSMRNGAMSVTAASATATFTADEIIVETALGGSPMRLASYSKAVNLATTGAGGMDTGTAPVSGYVALYAIYNPTTGTASILATNAATAVGNVYGGANMPAGYTASALLSVWPTNASSQFVVGAQRDRHVSIAQTQVLSSATPQASPTLLSISSAVPSNALSVSGILNAGVTGGTYIGGAVMSSPAAIGQTTIQNGGYNVTQSVGAFVVDLVTAQTIYYTFNAPTGTSPSIVIQITSYGF